MGVELIPKSFNKSIAEDDEALWFCWGYVVGEHTDTGSPNPSSRFTLLREEAGGDATTGLTVVVCTGAA